MGKKKKPRLQKPDEVLSMGPLQVARFGSNIVWESNWPEGAFAEIQKHQVELYPKVVQKIDALVAEIAKLVAESPPEKRLHGAWREMALRYIKNDSESGIGPDDVC